MKSNSYRIDYLIYFETLLSYIYMDNLVKKLEEQIAFLQHEISQMSDELYSQQKEVSVLKKQISNFEKRINDLENSNETGMDMEDKKPPHY
jgi:SlyX protein